MQATIQEELEDIDRKIGLVEDFDEELYNQIEVLDNLEQTIESQTYPWDLAETSETCTLMVSCIFRIRDAGVGLQYVKLP